MDGVVVSVPNDALFRELDIHNAFFDQLVDMLPAKLYVSGPTGDEMYSAKYHKGQHKESKEARRARNKTEKSRKFDPSKAETTLQVKKRRDRERENDHESESFGQTEDENDGMSVSHQFKDEESEKDSLPSSLNASRIDDLRAKLRAKIAERQSHRPSSAGTPEGISKRAARRAEKRKRQEEAKKRKQQQSGGGKSDVGKDSEKKVRFNELGGTRLNTKPGDISDSAVDLAGVDFGAIAGLSQLPHHADNKSLAGGKKKSLDRLLADAEKKANRLKELKASSSQEDKDKARSIEWGDVLKESTGERSRDKAPDQIKKEIKRRAKKKAKSADAWKARMKGTKEKMDERLKIRAHNLDQRKVGGATGANLSSKRIVADKAEEEKDGKKRPRIGPHAGKGRAGFEGKTQDFINSSKTGKQGGEKKSKSPQ